MYTTVHIILRLESIPTQYMSHTQQYTIYVDWSLFPHSTCHVHNNTLYTQDGVYSHMVHATYTTIHYTLRVEFIPTWYMLSTQQYTIHSGWSLFPHGTCHVHNNTLYTQDGVYSHMVHAKYTTVHYILRLEFIPTWYMPSTQQYILYSGWSLFPHSTCHVHNSILYTQAGVSPNPDFNLSQSHYLICIGLYHNCGKTKPINSAERIVHTIFRLYILFNIIRQ